MKKHRSTQSTVYDATKDITDVDIVRQRYYRLQAEQAAHNAIKQPVKTNWLTTLFAAR